VDERVRAHFRKHRESYVLGLAVVGTVGAVGAVVLLGGRKDLVSRAVDQVALPAALSAMEPVADVAVAVQRSSPSLHQVSGHLRTVVTGSGGGRVREVREIAPYVRGIASAA
jgi:hypothetical protein